MKLAKDCIDVGLYTNRRDEMLAFWTETIGLPYEELLKAGGGVHQHRLNLRGAVLKVNHTRAPLSEGRSAGYHRLLIPTQVSSPRELEDPDGNRVTLVPDDTLGNAAAGIVINVSDLGRQARFYAQLGLTQVNPYEFEWGRTRFSLTADAQAGRGDVSDMRDIGYRYTTVQVYKVDQEHERALRAGAIEVSKPRTLGTTARISFIQDPEGNFIEISQRASLTGSLAP